MVEATTEVPRPAGLDLAVEREAVDVIETWLFNNDGSDYSPVLLARSLFNVFNTEKRPPEDREAERKPYAERGNPYGD
jgi:hypothetical protein